MDHEIESLLNLYVMKLFGAFVMMNQSDFFARFQLNKSIQVNGRSKPFDKQRCILW